MNIRNFIILIALSGITLLAWYFSRHTTNQSPQEPEFETLIIGTNAEFPPFSFIEHDEIVGFDIDIVKEVAKRLNKNFKIKNMSFAALIPEIQLGTIHMIAAGMTPTKEREKRVFFTEPYLDKDPLVVVQPLHAKKIDSPNDLIGKTVIVNQGYTADNYLSDIQGIEVTRLSSPLISTGILALQSGKADAYIASQSSLDPYIQKQGSRNFQYTPLPDSEEIYALAISKKYPALYQHVQSILTDMAKDGTLNSLRTKWNL